MSADEFHTLSQFSRDFDSDGNRTRLDSGLECDDCGPAAARVKSFLNGRKQCVDRIDGRCGHGELINSGKVFVSRGSASRTPKEPDGTNRRDHAAETRRRTRSAAASTRQGNCHVRLPHGPENPREQARSMP